MLFRLVLLVIAGILLVGGAFLWIDHINAETKMTEELNSVLPPKKSAAKPARGVKPEAARDTTALATTNTVTTTDSSVATAIGSQLNSLQNTIKNIPNQILPSAGDSHTQTEIVASRLALGSQSASTLPAITREQAQPLARESAGKADPFSPIEGFKPFPKNGERIIARAPRDSAENSAAHKVDLIPPPPPGAIPPAPPPILAGQQETLPVDELPAPPEKPSIARYLKVVGILGDRAFMAVTDANVRRANRLPKVLTVSPGDRVEFVSVIDVTDSAVTLEEDGHRVVKHISALR